MAVKVPDVLEVQFRVTADHRTKFEAISGAIGMPVDTIAHWALTIGLEAVAANPALIGERIRKGFGR